MVPAQHLRSPIITNVVSFQFTTLIACAILNCLNIVYYFTVSVLATKMA